MKWAPGTRGSFSWQDQQNRFSPATPVAVAPPVLQLQPHSITLWEWSISLLSREPLSRSSAAPCWEPVLHSGQTPLPLHGAAWGLAWCFWKSYSEAQSRFLPSCLEGGCRKLICKDPDLPSQRGFLRDAVISKPGWKCYLISTCLGSRGSPDRLKTRMWKFSLCLLYDERQFTSCSWWSEWIAQTWTESSMTQVRVTPQMLYIGTEAETLGGNVH